MHMNRQHTFIDPVSNALEIWKYLPLLYLGDWECGGGGAFIDRRKGPRV
jgi:hypothetical protein